MVRLDHRVVWRKIAEHCWKQAPLAEVLNITERHVRNICKRDVDVNVSLCYSLSKVFGTTIEDLLVVVNEEEEK